MSEKSCELCKNQATLFCEPDQAILCWGCDEKVHSANFLVAKHSRTLLCQVCCSSTSWKASGLKLGPTFSVCHSCSDSVVAQSVRKQDFQGNNAQESETDDNGEYCSDSNSDYYSEENGDNQVVQVVPWENSSKRMRKSDACGDGCCSNSKLSAELDQSSYQVDYDGNDVSSSTSLLRPLKMRRMRNDHGSSVWDERSRMKLLKGNEAVLDKLRRLRHVEVGGNEEACDVVLRDG